MKQHQDGFTVIAGLLVVIIIGLVGGIGYYVLDQHDKAQKTAIESSGAANSTVAAPAVGTTESIDSMTNLDTASEAKINNQFSVSEQASAESTAPAANAVGGSYDESSL